MSEIPDLLSREQIAEFREALAGCERIYTESTEAVIRDAPKTVTTSLAEFRELQRDLSHGLMLKIFVEIGQSDWHWSTAERLLAIELFHYVWRQRVDPERVRMVLETIIDKSSTLSWSTLVRPFERRPAFKERIAELEAVTMRLAQIIAEIDGRSTDDEARRIRHIQGELRRNLRPVAIDPQEDLGGTQEAAPGQGTSASDVHAQLKLDNAPRIGDTTKSRAQLLAEALGELDRLIGLDGIKREIEELVNFLKVEDLRAARGLPRTGVSLHMTFRGNPGTGKTSVARLLGKIYGALGIVKKGHLVETDRTGLVAQYTGQTGPKTQKKIDEALDGVLFIDEAYTLIADSHDDQYGEEAVQALLKRMEDDRDRLIVILAGYPEPMERMISANPGLKSRFSRDLTFPDYTAAELGRIFERHCVGQRYTVSVGARLKLLVGFQCLLDKRDERFGNGRLARNVFESAIRRMANRIVSLSETTDDHLTTIEPDDILMDTVTAEDWREGTAAAKRLIMTCPGCRQPAKFSVDLLGQSVRCNRCSQRFRADWADILR